MATLEGLLRGGRVYRGGGYLPFTQPPYRGGYPFTASRGFNLTPNGLLSLALTARTISPLRRPLPSTQLSQYEDRRLWHPDGVYAWPKSKVEKYPRITLGSEYIPGPYEPYWAPRYPDPRRSINWPDMARKSIRLAPATNQWSWEDPYKMIICLKRKMRREIMHALHLAGKTGFKKPKYTQFSYVRCF